MLSFTDLLQTSKMKIFLTPYYSSSWDETILLYESFEISSGRENEMKNWKRSLRSSKIDFYEDFSKWSFFDLRRANFVPTFNLDKVYKPTIPPGWDIFQLELYPEMDSNWNLNGWT